MPDLADQVSVLLGGIHPQQGWQQTITVPAPAVGAPLAARVIPGETWERVVMLKCTVTMSAAVLNRFPTVRYLDGDGNVVYQIGSGAATVAGQSVTFYAAPGGANQINASGSSWVALPDMLLPSGWSVAVANPGSDPGDQIGVISLVVQRFPTNAVRATAD